MTSTGNTSKGGGAQTDQHQSSDDDKPSAAQKRHKDFVAYPIIREPVATGIPYQLVEWNTSLDGLAMLFLTLVCAFTRLYRIGLRSNVTWDESHFVKFSGFYLNRTFYHDVHPPLAKMLIALADVLAGHNGTFNPDTTKTYPDYYSYRFMRCFTALFGIGLAPLAYLTCLQLNMRRKACMLAGLFVILDNALCVMSRFVLLDEPLLFFTAASLCSISGFQNMRHRAFSPAWWRWLLLTGVSLGLVSSCKWVGFLTVAMVGLYTIEELLNLFADFAPTSAMLRHFSARAVSLVAIPLLIYMTCFKAHFIVLNRSGPGDATMPPAFQARLQGSKLSNQPFTVMYGSVLDLRSMYPGSGLLHSHAHKYPSGSQQQQITCYNHQDKNNDWVIMRRLGEEFNYTTDPLLPVRDGDIVRLMHKQTSSMLHSHRAFTAPLTTVDYEVTAYGKSSWNDTNNDWKIAIHKEESSSAAKDELHTITTQFRLRHVATGCWLSAAAVKLPSWGFRQNEVTCSRDQSSKSDASLWAVERHVNSRVPAVDMRSLVKTSFVQDFVRLNIEMARSNNALIPDRDKHNHLESPPWSWPFLVYPMRMLGSWNKGDIKYYEIGNPLLWWASTLACLLFPLQLVYYYARKSRGIANVWAPREEQHFWNAGKLLWGGWALHYMPFFLMGRVTYIHHYLPALYFALLLLAFEVDHFGRRMLGGRLQVVLVLVLGAAATLVFCWFAPLTFGYTGSMDDLKHRQWLPTWNIYKDKHSM